jgi:hypothetical protein
MLHYDKDIIMKPSGSSETSVQFFQTTRRCIADGSNFQNWYCWGMVLSLPLPVIDVTGAHWPTLGGCDFGLSSHGSKTNYDFLSSLISSALFCDMCIPL